MGRTGGCKGILSRRPLRGGYCMTEWAEIGGIQVIPPISYIYIYEIVVLYIYEGSFRGVEYGIFFPDKFCAPCNVTFPCNLKKR